MIRRIINIPETLLSVGFNTTDSRYIQPNDEKYCHRVYVNTDTMDVYYFTPNARTPYMIAKVWSEFIEEIVDGETCYNTHYSITGFGVLDKFPDYIVKAVGKAMKELLHITEQVKIIREEIGDE